MSLDDSNILFNDVDSDEDIHELRLLAINSMGKPDKNSDVEMTKSVSSLSNTNSPLSNDLILSCGFKVDYKASLLSSRKRLSSENSNEESKKPKLNGNQNCNVETIIRESLSDMFPVENIEDKVESAKNILKEEELKLKLLKVLNNKNEKDTKKHTKIPEKKIFIDQSFCESDENDDFRIFTDVLLPKEIITDPKVLKYHNLIIKVKSYIDNISKSINSMSNSIQDSLLKSKKITTQIENLKSQKIEVHKDISVNRRKILDYNKIKKLKSLELLKYEKLKKKLSDSLLRPVSRNVEIADSCSSISGDIPDSRRSNYEIDCNQIICPFWLNNNCLNKSCVYQHLKIVSKPVIRKNVKIKENDKVFLKEMNPRGFISKLMCEACSETILMPTLHLNDDWHCKSCCQQLITLKKPSEVLNQLISIWHHIYKRFVMSKNVSLENRDPQILQNLIKCSEAIKAKLYSSINLSPEKYQIAAYHVILTLNEESKVDNLLDFIKNLNYNSNVVLFAVKLSFPIPKLLQLVVDSICYQMKKSSAFPNIDSLIKQFCSLSKSLDRSVIDQLIDWLDLSIKNNFPDCLITTLTKIVLSECLGPEFVPGLSLSMHDLVLGDKYWYDRKDLLTKLIQIYHKGSTLTTNSLDWNCCCSWMDNSNHLLLIKYFIICNFFTGNEDGALELCERFSLRHYAFQILSSKLSLKYNSPLIVGDNDKLMLIEHAYNKSEWLLANRSVNSSVKWLENIPQMLYHKIGPHHQSDPVNDPIRLYQFFLELTSQFDGNDVNLSMNVNENEMKSIRESSPIWLCYINLLILTNQSASLHQLIQSDRLLSLTTDHLIRVAYILLIQFGKMYTGDQYYDHLRTMFLFVEKSIDFVHFFDLFSCVNFDSLLNHQLSMWLFLIDFCLIRFSDDDVDCFLVAASRKLCVNHIVTNVSRQVFHHIVMCYPIRVVDVWLNYIRLLLNINSPLYELIDSCEMATNRFPSSKLLWQHYHSCGSKSGNDELVRKIKEKATKFGFDLN